MRRVGRRRLGAIRGMRGDQEFNLSHVEFEVSFRRQPQINLRSFFRLLQIHFTLTEHC